MSVVIAKRILLITQWFQPEPTLKGIFLARELVAHGFEVEVITGFPNYPGGKLYPGYKLKLFQREVIDGVLVTRVPLYPSHDASKLGRIANYISFSVSSLIYGLFFAKRPDVIHAYHPPISVALSSVIIKFFRRVPIVLDIQDIWPDTLKATGMVKNSTLLTIVAKICNVVYRVADQIVVLSPGFKRLLISRGVPSKKIDVIYNWADERNVRNFSQESCADILDWDGFKILYAGNVGRAQGLSVILDTALLVKDKFPTLCFVVLGQGLELNNLKVRAKQLNLNNVKFVPAVATDKIGKYLEAADALLIHLIADPLFQITIPGKTQAYMAAGKPIIMGVLGDASNLISKANCGLCIEPQNEQALAGAATKLMHLTSADLHKLGKNGSSFYDDNLSVKMGVKTWIVVLKKAIKGNRS